MTAPAWRIRDRRYWRNIILFTLASLFAGCVFFQYVGHPFFLSYGWAHPQRLAVCCATPADRGLTYEDASFTTRDGLTLRGWYIPSKNKAAVMLLHPVASNRIGMLDAAAMLARHGYGALLFDLRAHGDSEGDVLPFGGNEAEDVIGAATYLQTRADVDPDRIGALGWSLGAQVSILGAARTQAVKAVVADGPCCTTFGDIVPPQSFGDWLYVPYDMIFFPMLHWRTGVSQPLSVNQALAQIAPRPVLLIGGGPEQNMAQYKYDAAREPKTLWIIPEARHIDGLTVKPQEYEDTVVGFFDAALLSGSP